MRLVIVSNRLPLTVSKRGDQLDFVPSNGGLATGLKSFIETLPNDNIDEFVWIGWPGVEIAPGEQENVRSKLSNFNYSPVFYSSAEYEEFYVGFCNSTLWPLFHSFQTLAAFNAGYWQHYKAINQLYYEAIAKILRPDDIVWIHDFHLLMLPGMIRKHHPACAIGFFLHIPFPPFEIFRLLSAECRRDILSGMAGADLIGFHTYDYAQDFIKSMSRTLNCESVNSKIAYDDRFVSIGVFPMGIDYQMFHNASNETATREASRSLRNRLGVKKMILSIDRLDYTKGIINRLHAYQELLRSHPEYIEQVTLNLVVVPSRTDVPSYSRMKEQIDELVGNINGEFSQKEWTPIIYQFKCKNFQELVALYLAADIALVTPLRDGMNLIAKEYVASRSDATGVLILSEMAGASRELIDAKIVNPYHVDEITQALTSALEMSDADQRFGMEKLRERVKSYDIIRWSGDFLKDLVTGRKLNNTLKRSKAFDNASKRFLAKQITNATRRVLLIDYDGTLIGFKKYPQLAYPSGPVLEVLEKINSLPDTKVIILSGRDRFTMDKWFRDFGFDLLAENGAWIKRDGTWDLTHTSDADWKEQIKPILQGYASRLPGSFIEEKQFAVTWHYRNSEAGLSSSRTTELQTELTKILQLHDLDMTTEVKSVEIRKRGISKAGALSRVLSAGADDFIACFGDDHSDEAVFRMLPESAYTFKVGIEPTIAKFRLTSDVTVRDVLSWFVESLEEVTIAEPR